MILKDDQSDLLTAECDVKKASRIPILLFLVALLVSFIACIDPLFELREVK